MQPVQLDDYLPTLEETSAAPGGRPLTLSLDAIDEDPAQPRTEFDPEALGELAASIASRGVLQPVSVRRHPELAGRWVLNFGARRYRAAKLAGRSEIPAFEDGVADSYSQVIENEHREALRPMDLALFVKGRLDAGQSQAEIARHLGKSRAYVNYVCALIDPPDWLMALYRDGKCRGVKELYDLRRMHDEHPAEVRGLINGHGALSRGEVARLREDLAASSAESVSTSERHSAARKPGTTPRREREGRDGRASPKTRRGEKQALPTGGRLSLSAEANGCLVIVMLDELPAAGDEVFVVDDADGKRRSVKLNRLQAFHLRRD
jgi:ParB family transcriptional regulator, chromosome partitioning protein